MAICYKISHMFFCQSVFSKNWFALSMYIIIVVDLLIGCLVVVTIALIQTVYAKPGTREEVPGYTKVILLLQKILYSIIILE